MFLYAVLKMRKSENTEEKNGTLQKYCSAEEILHEMAAPFRFQAQ